jgi:hypothetical protein
MFAACLYSSSKKSMRIVEGFLRDNIGEARHMGWSDDDLFGCYPDAAFAGVRYDAMGPVTLAAFMAQPVIAVSGTSIRLANKLSARRPASRDIAQPVWSVFSGVDVHS